MTQFYTNFEINEIRLSNRIPDTARDWVASDGTLIFANSTVTREQLGLDRPLPDGIYDRSRFAVAGVYLIVPPRDQSTQQTQSTSELIVLPPAAASNILPISTQSVSNGSQYLQVRIGVYSPPLPSQTSLRINISVFPSIPIFETQELSVDWSLIIRPIPIALTDAILHAARRLLDGKIPSYFDNDRVGKTLLNFGQDYQMPIVNWQYDTNDASGKTILVKTYRPIPEEIELYTELWIDRELSPSLIDQLFVVFIPGQGLRVYLRPPNRNINVRNLDGHEVNNVTLTSLLTTGSFDIVTSNDPIMEEWFVTSLEGAELNIDYADYSNFVFYSSAVERVRAFKQKLLTIENYDSVILAQSSSIASATSASGISGFTSSLAYQSVVHIADQRSDLIRSFDGYERFLYYNSASAYSSSFSGEPEDQIYYLLPAAWPKISGSVIPVTSAASATSYSVLLSDNVLPGIEDLGFGYVAWLDAIEYVASEYDRQNQNRLVNNLPEYLVNDPRSSDFIKFVDLIGHHFDILKSYADAMPDIYDRNNDPSTGLSPDMIWTIAEAFGISLPNQYAIKTLVDYTIGEIGQTSPKVYREFAAETWKRFLHNHIFLTKAKGTKAALRGLLNSYGILPTTIQIRETATPSFYTTQSYEIIEEQTNTLDIQNNAFIQLPWTGSGLPAINTVQTRFSTTNITQSVLYNVDQKWSVQLIPTSTTYGRVAFVSGTTIAASSSIFTIFDGTFFNTTLQYNSGSVRLWVQQSDDDGDLIHNSYTTSSAQATGIWASGSTLYLGASGSTSVPRFVGQIDEFRMWTEELTPSTIDFHAKYSGLYNGNTVSSAKDSLPVRLSFAKPRNLGTATVSDRFILNESPYIRVSGRSPLLTQFSASLFLDEQTYPYSMEVVTRNVLRYSPNSGGSQYVSNKIVIADPPVVRYLDDDASSNIPVLSHKKSMVTVDKKSEHVQSNNTIGFFFSVTDAINDNIVRSIGNIDIQDYIGDPSSMYDLRYNDLDTLNKLYWTNYAYTYNYNSFVEFVNNLLQPMFKQAEDLVPVRSKLLTGIVLEPHILERNKIQWKPINTSGKGTFDESVTPTLEPDALSMQPSTVDATYLVSEAMIDFRPEDVMVASYDVMDGLVVNSNNNQLVASWDVRDGVLDIHNTLPPIDTSYDTYDAIAYALDSIDNIDVDVFYYDSQQSALDYMKLLLRRFNATSILEITDSNKAAFNQLLVTYAPGSNISVGTGLNPAMSGNLFSNIIEPTSNFNDIGAVNYFTQRSGFVLIPVQSRVRLGNATLSSAGTWTYGSTYAVNQFVTQSNQSGSAADGNGFEWVCISPAGSGSFISYNPPSLDVTNWRKMRYTSVITYNIKVATLLNNRIELVNSSLGYTPFTGFSRNHYRFTRDTSTATKRRLWKGCKQTDASTFDGGPAVEIMSTGGDVLIVSTGAEPIQRKNDGSGPILDVR